MYLFIKFVWLLALIIFSGLTTRSYACSNITPVQWSDASQARSALTQNGFNAVGFLSQEGFPLNVHIYRSSEFVTNNGPIWFVMHGVDRNADHYATVAAAVAERYQAMVVAIEFSTGYYPTGDSYTFGIVTHGSVDATAGPEGRFRVPENYVYTEIERVFESIRTILGGQQAGYYLFGHSAGAQFTHRLLTFMPCARVLNAISANAGWYTLPTSDGEYSLPYSLRDGPAHAMDARPLLDSPLVLLLGTNDTLGPDQDPNVRGTPEAMAQGPHRFARGNYYYSVGQSLATSINTPFSWRLRSAPGAGHNVRHVVASAGYLHFTNYPACSPSSASQAAGIKFNEILWDPPSTMQGDANRDGVFVRDEEQFIEIVNTGSTPICLSGWTLGNASGSGWHLFPLGSALAPRGALVVFGGGVPIGTFSGAYVQNATDSDGLDLLNDGDRVYLRDGGGATVRSLSWGNCGGVSCASDHWSGTLNMDSSIVRWPTTEDGWRVHSQVSSSLFSPGIINTGTPEFSFTTNPTNITNGESSTLAWSAVTNATSCIATGGTFTGSKSTNGGTQSVSPTTITVYTLSCTGANGTTSQMATVNVMNSKELIIDNTDSSVSQSGTWRPSISFPGYYGTNYHYSPNQNGEWFEWQATNLVAGTYQVFAYWNSNANRPTDASYLITRSGGNSTVNNVNQTQNGNRWNLLGTYAFGTTGSVRVISGATGTEGTVADAVRFVRTSTAPCNTITPTSFSQAVYNSYGAPYDVFTENTPLINVRCNSADTDTINLTTGITGDATRIIYTKGYWYDPVTAGWQQYTGTCTGAINGDWCQGSVSATITDPNVSTASAGAPTYLVGMTCRMQGGSWRCGCRDTTCANFLWQVQGAGM